MFSGFKTKIGQGSTDAVRVEDLQRTITDQERIIEKYEKRLRSLVSAYKSLQAEKNSLEQSLSVLNAASDDEATDAKATTTAGDSGTDREDASIDTESLSEIGHVSTIDRIPSTTSFGPATGPSLFEDDPVATASELASTSSGIARLKKQIKVLSKSLKTVAEEKEKLQVNWSSEYKRLQMEAETAAKEAQEKNNKLSLERDELFAELTVVRDQLELEKQRRSAELADRETVVGQFQSLLADERKQRTEMELRIAEQMTGQVELDGVRQQLAEKKRMTLENELRLTRQELNNIQLELTKPSPLVEQLRQELDIIRSGQQSLVENERVRSQTNVDSLQSSLTNREKFIGRLEKRCQELADQLGRAEAALAERSVNDLKLKDRLRMAEQELAELRTDKRSSSPRKEKPSRSFVVTPEMVYDEFCQIVDVKRSILVGGTQLNELAQIGRALVFVSQQSTVGEEGQLLIVDAVKQLVAGCVLGRRISIVLPSIAPASSLVSLRPQSPVRPGTGRSEQSPATEQPSTGGQSTKSRSRSTERQLEERLAAAERQLTETRDQLRAEKVQALCEAAAVHQSQMTAVQSSHEQRVRELEQNLVDYKDKMMEILADKERELLEPNHSSADGSNAGQRDPDLVQNLVTAAGDGSSSRLEDNYVMEDQQKRLLSEIAFLKSDNRLLTSSLREQQIEFAAMQTKFTDQLQFLKRELSSIQRSRSASSENVEYIRNLFLKYLTSTSSDVKRQALKTVLVVLQLDRNERKQILEAAFA